MIDKLVAFRIKSALVRKCFRGYDELEYFPKWQANLIESDNELKKKFQNVRATFKLPVPNEHLQIFAHSQDPDRLLFYVISNSRTTGGKQS